jgi:undecaprenyl-diphosphatase
MQWDTDLFLWLNQDLGETTDRLMVLISSKFIAIPLYLFLAWKISQKSGKHIWKFLLGVVLMILVTDQTSVAVKNLIQRPRPCHEISLQGQVHQVDGKCGGSYGFYSSSKSYLSSNNFINNSFNVSSVSVYSVTFNTYNTYSYGIYFGSTNVFNNFSS